MSLTILLQNSAILREKLRASFIIPDHQLSAEMVAPPLSTGYAVVGTATDYLLRFKTEHLNRGKIITSQEWVADQALMMLKGHLLTQGNKKIALGRGNGPSIQAKKLFASLDSNHKAAKKRVSNFLKSGNADNDLVESALFLARLDAFYRAGIIDPGLIEVDSTVVEDIAGVFAHAPDHHFSALRSCHLNPTFGKASTLVGGADADVILDDMLIEIKTTKHLRLDRNYFDQLICYYVLSLIGGVSEKPKDKPIKRIGIYFSRHGLMWSTSLDDLGSDSDWQNFRQWFVHHLKEYPWWAKTSLPEQGVKTKMTLAH